ncbi:MAG TPA: hypothetical protein EYG89_02510 [Bacteroidia bacterium]|nr:hypothetical protein [Bacteroidia bacterium]
MVFVSLKIFSFLLLLFSFSFSEILSVKLSTLTGNKSVELKGIRANYIIHIPLNPLWKVNKVILFLYFKSSAALKAERSEISVLLNNQLISSKKLGREGIINISLKNPNLRDFNTLDIRVSQHYCINCCEDKNSPELWTYLDFEKSYIIFNYKERKFPKSIAFLKEVFLSTRLLSPIEFDFILEDRKPSFIKPASILAGFLGAKIKYRDIYIDYSEKLREKNTFIIGTYNFISEILKSYKPDGNIQIVRNPLNPSRFVLILTGDTEEEVLNSVLAFILAPSAYLSEESVYVSEVSLPSFKPYSSPILLSPGQEINFGKLVKDDIVINGYGQRVNISFFIPPDLFLTPKEKIKIKLFYNHGLLVREDSTINLYINDKFVYSIPVDPEDERELKVAEIKIPTSVLKKGFNILTIESALVPYKRGFCSIANYKNSKLVIYGNSSIYLPTLVHWTEMPYLEYFTYTGYPFTFYPDMKNTLVVLESTDKKTLSSLFTLFAFIGSRVQIPPFRVEISTNITQENRNKDIIFFWKKNSLVRKSILSSSNSEVKIRGLINGREGNVFKVFLRKNSISFTLAMRESPFKKGRTILVFNSKDSDTLYEFIKVLYKPMILSKVRGDTVFYNKESIEIYSFSSGNKYYVGNMPLYKEVYYRIGYNIKYLAVIFLISLILLSLAVKKLLDYISRKRFQVEEGKGGKEK